MDGGGGIPLFFFQIIFDAAGPAASRLDRLAGELSAGAAALAVRTKLAWGDLAPRHWAGRPSAAFGLLAPRALCHLPRLSCCYSARPLSC